MADVKLPLTIDVPVNVISGNMYMRLHWARRMKYHAQLWEGIKWIAREQSAPPEKRRMLTIISYRRKLCDDDNLRFGCKPIVDILVKQKYFKDDSPQWIKVNYYQERISHNPKDQPHTVITIEEYAGDPHHSA